MGGAYGRGHALWCLYRKRYISTGRAIAIYSATTVPNAVCRRVATKMAKSQLVIALVLLSLWPENGLGSHYRGGIIMVRPVPGGAPNQVIIICTVASQLL